MVGETEIGENVALMVSMNECKLFHQTIIIVQRKVLCSCALVLCSYVLCRVVMVGEAKVGKTALRRRIELGDNKFGNEYKETIGVDFASRRVNVGFSDEYKREVLLQVFDVGGAPYFCMMFCCYLPAWMASDTPNFSLLYYSKNS